MRNQQLRDYTRAQHMERGGLLPGRGKALSTGSSRQWASHFCYLPATVL